jgi:hypothetical protein
MKLKMIVGVIALAAAFIVSASAASAQSPPLSADGRWTPYLGCWRLLPDSPRNQGMQDWFRSITETASTPPMTVCVRPSSADDAPGVIMTTFADGKKVLEQTIAADGGAHPVTESGCAGTQSTTWSRNGLRLFTRVEMTCSDRPQQAVTGITLLTKGPTWVDIQSMSTDSEPQLRVRRYVRTRNVPEGVAPLSDGVTLQALNDAQNVSVRARLSLEDVLEASAKASPQAVEAAIIETDSRFNLNSRGLLQLADARVSPEVIDLMVSQSFPSHFKTERPAVDMSVADSLPSVMMSPPGEMEPLYPYVAYDPYYFSYYYSPFAYPYYWGLGYYHGPRYYLGGGTSTVIPGGGTVPGSSAGHGVIVNSRGYTRPRTATGAEGSQPGATAAAPGATGGSIGGAGAGSSGSGGSTGSSGSSGSSSSGGASGSGGGSSGGSVNTGGRTAQPR